LTPSVVALRRRTSTNKLEKVVGLYIRTSYGVGVLVTFRWEQSGSLIGVRFHSSDLTRAVVSEIDTTLKII
jgi:hypothetical protein